MEGKKKKNRNIEHALSLEYILLDIAVALLFFLV